MKKAVILNLSPRKTGTSVMLANRCKEFLSARDYLVEILHLYPNLKDLSPLLAAINEAESIIMVGPSYIDTYPADTVYLLEEIEKNRDFLHGQDLYGIIQGGMPYVHTHESGLKMLELFAGENDLSYKGGFVIGMGAMLNGQPLDKLLNGKKAETGFEQFLENVAKQGISPPSLYYQAQLKMPGLVYWFMATLMNRKIDKDRREKGIGDQAKSPYDNLEIN
jgi:multimeric flavodoxin WrbA